jgi:hypothetical protein
MSTPGAFQTGVTGIDLNQSYAREDGFVFEKLTQLRECPGVQNRSLRFPSPYPLADARQLLDGNPASGAFGFLNNLFRNRMVDVLGKAKLFAGMVFQVSFGRLALYRLEVLSQLAMPVANVVHHRTAKFLAIGIRSDLNHSQIDSQKIIDRRRWRIVDVAGCGQEPLAAMPDQVRLALLRTKLLFLALPGRKWNTLSSTGCPDTHAILGKTQNAAVLGDGSTPGESALALLIQLVGIRDFGKSTNNHLSAQREPLPCRAVKRFVQLDLREYLALPGLMAQPVSASVGRFHGVKQRLVLLRTRVQTDFSGKFHYLNVIATKGMRFLCQLKQAVSSHKIL